MWVSVDLYVCPTSRGSRSKTEVNIWCVVVDIGGSACQVQQHAMAVRSGAKYDYYQSTVLRIQVTGMAFMEFAIALPLGGYLGRF